MSKYPLLMVLTLQGCMSPEAARISPPPAAARYQLVADKEGKLFRIDTASGDTRRVDPSSVENVTPGLMPQLVVGKIYRSEDGKVSYRYSGSGQLEKWGLEKYEIPAPAGSTREQPTR